MALQAEARLAGGGDGSRHGFVRRVRAGGASTNTLLNTANASFATSANGMASSSIVNSPSLASLHRHHTNSSHHHAALGSASFSSIGGGGGVTNASAGSAAFGGGVGSSSAANNNSGGGKTYVFGDQMAAERGRMLVEARALRHAHGETRRPANANAIANGDDASEYGTAASRQSLSAASGGRPPAVQNGGRRSLYSAISAAAQAAASLSLTPATSGLRTTAQRPVSRSTAADVNTSAISDDAPRRGGHQQMHDEKETAGAVASRLLHAMLYGEDASAEADGGPPETLRDTNASTVSSNRHRSPPLLSPRGARGVGGSGAGTDYGHHHHHHHHQQQQSAAAAAFAASRAELDEALAEGGLAPYARTIGVPAAHSDEEGSNTNGGTGRLRRSLAPAAPPGAVGKKQQRGDQQEQHASYNPYNDPSFDLQRGLSPHRSSAAATATAPSTAVFRSTAPTRLAPLALSNPLEAPPPPMLGVADKTEGGGATANTHAETPLKRHGTHGPATLLHHEGQLARGGEVNESAVDPSATADSRRSDFINGFEARVASRLARLEAKERAEAARQRLLAAGSVATEERVLSDGVVLRPTAGENDRQRLAAVKAEHRKAREAAERKEAEEAAKRAAEEEAAEAEAVARRTSESSLLLLSDSQHGLISGEGAADGRVAAGSGGVVVALIGAPATNSAASAADISKPPQPTRLGRGNNLRLQSANSAAAAAAATPGTASSLFHAPMTPEVDEAFEANGGGDGEEDAEAAWGEEEEGEEATTANNTINKKKRQSANNPHIQLVMRHVNTTVRETKSYVAAFRRRLDNADARAEAVAMLRSAFTAAEQRIEADAEALRGRAEAIRAARRQRCEELAARAADPAHPAGPLSAEEVEELEVAEAEAEEERKAELAKRYGASSPSSAPLGGGASNATTADLLVTADGNDTAATDASSSAVKIVHNEFLRKRERDATIVQRLFRGRRARVAYRARRADAYKHSADRIAEESKALRDKPYGTGDDELDAIEEAIAEAEAALAAQQQQLAHYAALEAAAVAEEAATCVQRWFRSLRAAKAAAAAEVIVRAVRTMRRRRAMYEAMELRRSAMAGQLVAKAVKKATSRGASLTIAAAEVAGSAIRRASQLSANANDDDDAERDGGEAAEGNGAAIAAAAALSANATPRQTPRRVRVMEVPTAGHDAFS